MIHWFSPSKMCFYHGSFHGKHQLPGDVVELTDDEYKFLISQNQRGMSIVLKEGRPTISTPA